MDSLDMLFRKRIGYSSSDALTFDDLPALLSATSQTLPFENLAIIKRRGLPITRENLVDKMLIRREGGLCYELNPLLYFFLLENGFNVSMRRGIVFSAETQTFAATGHTHVTILLQHEGQTYLVDTGFGGYLPLRPVTLDGETVESSNGEFRIRPATGENAVHGDLVFELKQRYKDEDWRVGYVFDSVHPISTVECEEIRQVIAEHPASLFNKRPLVTRLTERGSVTLTDTSLSVMESGEVLKESVKLERFSEFLAQYFRAE